MRVIDLENINYAMRSETQFVLRCEEVFHDKISAAATTILSNKGEKPLVALTGPSGSGKTTTAMRLQEYLQNLGVTVKPYEAVYEETLRVQIETILDLIFEA